MVAEDTVFSVLYDKFMFWSILVGIFTFGWMFLAMLRYRDGVEPDTSHIDHIEVGAFPVDRHNTPIEVLFYVVPTIIVAWLVVLALSSNTEVWVIPEDSEGHNMVITGKQWFWEFEYEDSLTWEDDVQATSVDVDWAGTALTINGGAGSQAVNATVTVKGESTDYELDQMTVSLDETLTFDPYAFATVEVTDNDGNVIHTWMHIPKGHIFSSAASEDMIIPCDVPIIFEMHSKPSDDSNPKYVGVQHSFGLPEWGVKEDLVPGLENGTYMTVTPDDAGVFDIRCYEYCGNQHSQMVGQVKVVAMEDYANGLPKGTNCATEDTFPGSPAGANAGGDY